MDDGNSWIGYIMDSVYHGYYDIICDQYPVSFPIQETAGS